MATIESGVSSTDKWTIDPVSKAGRVTLYDSSGNELSQPPAGAYSLAVNVRQTAATAANAVVWAMRNGATKTVVIRRIKLAQVFDGTAAAATTVRYTIQRFTAANPTAGTAITVGKRQTSSPATTVQDARFLDTGLTTAGITFDGIDLMILGVPVSVTGTLVAHDIATGGDLSYFSNFELAASEGLCIRLSTAAVAGAGLYGGIVFDER